MAFYNKEELENIGFKKLGINVLISNKVSFYGCENIEIGDYSRIDDFCVISAGQGGIKIGRNVHIAVFCSVIGSGEIVLDDYSCISSRVAVYSSNDDYSGEYMTNPTVPMEFTNVTSNPVRIGKHVVVGSGSVILPGVEVHDGCAVGALSLISKSCEGGYIYIGSPAKKIKKRSDNIFKLEMKFLSNSNNY